MRRFSLPLLALALITGCPGDPDTPTLYALGGTVRGLEGSGLVLQNNGGDDLSITADGEFRFATDLAAGTTYDVSVLTQPTGPGQTCAVTDGAGTIEADVLDITVACERDSHTVGGTVSGLIGSGLVLQNNGGDDLPISADGPFTFSTPVTDGGAYAVTVLTQPTGPVQTCSVASGDGTATGANVTTVAVTCATDGFLVGGTVNGLLGDQLVLQNSGGDDLTLIESGAFSFATPVESGAAYEVTVLTQPASPNQVCGVAAGSGTVGAGDVTDVVVDCVTETYTVGGAVSGIVGTGLVIELNGGDPIVLDTDSLFTFTTPVPDGSGYSVQVATHPSGPNQLCTVGGGMGRIDGADVNSVIIECETLRYSVTATVTGVASQGLQLSLNGGTPLAVASSGAVTFPTALEDGSAYAVTVVQDPTYPRQVCAVTGGTGTLAGADVSDVVVDCTTLQYEVQGSLSGPIRASDMTLTIAWGLFDQRDLLFLPRDTGPYAFTDIPDGAKYVVYVSRQPAGQACSVTNPTGRIDGANAVGVDTVCDPLTYPVRVTVTGMGADSGLVIQNNSIDELVIDADGTYQLTAAVPQGGGYEITVATHPATKACTVAGGVGVASGNVEVSITCTDNATPQPFAGAGGVPVFLRNGDSPTAQGTGFDLADTHTYTWREVGNLGVTFTNNGSTDPTGTGVSYVFSPGVPVVEVELTVEVADGWHEPVVSPPETYRLYRSDYTYVRSGGTSTGDAPDRPLGTIRQAMFFLSGRVGVAVAAGTYMQNSSIGENIKLMEGISVYGGFEPTTWERAPRVHVSSIEDVVPVGAYAERDDPFRPVEALGPVTRATVFDGFSIRASSEEASAGVVLHGSPTLSNNHVYGRDFGVLVPSSGSPRIVGNRITGNTAVEVMYAAGVEVSRNLLIGGLSSEVGQGIRTEGALDLLITNNLITGAAPVGSWDCPTGVGHSRGIELNFSAARIYNNSINGGTCSDAAAITTYDSPSDIQNNVFFADGPHHVVSADRLIRCLDLEEGAPPTSLRTNTCLGRLPNTPLVALDAGLCPGDGDGDGRADTCSVSEVEALYGTAASENRLSADILMLVDYDGSSGDLRDIDDNDWRFVPDAPWQNRTGGLCLWPHVTDDFEGNPRTPVAAPPTGCQFPNGWSRGAYEQD